MRILLIQFIAVIVGQFLACGDIPPGHNPNGASREMHRPMRVAGMVDVSGFIIERLPVDIPAGVEGAQNALWADFGNVSLSSGASSLRT